MLNLLDRCKVVKALIMEKKIDKNFERNNDGTETNIMIQGLEKTETTYFVGSQNIGHSAQSGPSPSRRIIQSLIHHYLCTIVLLKRQRRMTRRVLSRGRRVFIVWQFLCLLFLLRCRSGAAFYICAFAVFSAHCLGVGPVVSIRKKNNRANTDGYGMALCREAWMGAANR